MFVFIDPHRTDGHIHRFQTGDVRVILFTVFVNLVHQFPVTVQFGDTFFELSVGDFPADHAFDRFLVLLEFGFSIRGRRFGLNFVGHIYVMVEADFRIYVFPPGNIRLPEVDARLRQSDAIQVIVFTF